MHVQCVDFLFPVNYQVCISLKATVYFALICSSKRPGEEEVQSEGLCIRTQAYTRWLGGLSSLSDASVCKRLGVSVPQPCTFQCQLKSCLLRGPQWLPVHSGPLLSSAPQHSTSIPNLGSLLLRGYGWWSQHSASPHLPRCCCVNAEPSEAVERTWVYGSWSEECPAGG